MGLFQSERKSVDKKLFLVFFIKVYHLLVNRVVIANDFLFLKTFFKTEKTGRILKVKFIVRKIYKSRFERKSDEESCLAIVVLRLANKVLELGVI